MAVDPSAGKPMTDQGDGNMPAKHSPDISGTENSGNSMMMNMNGPGTIELTLARAKADRSANDMMQENGGPHR